MAAARGRCQYLRRRLIVRTTNARHVRACDGLSPCSRVLSVRARACCEQSLARARLPIRRVRCQ
eukprot:6181049-Pleurochrysis_carterae.AAC.1